MTLQSRDAVRKILIARALAVVTAPSARRLATARDHERLGVPAHILRDLATEIEREYPGIVERCRERLANSRRVADLARRGMLGDE